MAMQQYFKALKHNDQNLYAVIGIANCIAEKGMLEEASIIYKQVIE